MFFPSKKIYYEYHPFIMKMHVESPKNDTSKKNLNVLCDMELILGLPCLLPLFECVHKLIKIVQGWDVFICNIVEAVKLGQLELYKLYCHFFTKFEDVALMFQCNWKLDKCNNVDAMVLWLKWRRGCIIPCILFFGKRYLIYSYCIEGVVVPQPIIKVVFGMAMNKVKEKCERTTWRLISKLEMQIPK